MKKEEMLEALERIRLTKGRVIVAGDVIYDVFTVGYPERESSEQKGVPVIKVTGRTKMPGGAGNVAANIVALGGQALLISAVGIGDTSRELTQLLKDKHILTEGLIHDQSRWTTRKERVLNGNQQMFCLAFETKDPVGGWVIEKAIETIETDPSSIVVLSDYGRGMMSEALIRRAITARPDKRIITDVHVREGFDANCLKGAFLIKPNRTEAAALAGTGQPNGHDQAEEIARKLVDRFEANILLTRDHEGMTLATSTGEIEHFPALEKEAVCVSGAGDTAVAAIALGLASDLSLREAVYLGCIAAAVAVKKPGTATVSPEEMKRVIETL